jgi:gamma-glutamyltranspeptidase/glutathione hydrolase
MAPAIRLAEVGFTADAHDAATAAALAERFAENPGWQQRFALVWTRYLLEGRLKVGDRIRVPEQAAALRMIAEAGASAFYEGEIGRSLVHAARKDGADLTLADLRAYRPRETQPIRSQIGGYEFVGMPPPSSGGATVIQALQMLDAAGYSFASGPRDDASLHVLTESFKQSFADRAKWFGDPAFVDVPVDWLVSRARALVTSAAIDPAHTRPPQAYGTDQPLGTDGGTSHLSVVDAQGNAVACTETINLEFGSLVGVDEFGFVLNNEMDDFLTQRGEANAFGLVQSDRNLPSPGKRPLSSMSPTLVFDGSGLLAVAGGSGGPRIISATTQVLLRVLAGESASAAVGAPRLHHQWMPNRIELEPDLAQDEALRAALVARGHEVVEREQIGNVQLIRRTAGGWEAASDRRKGGTPVGY